MEPDFSGWATKAGLKCSDGRTIMEGAFKHQDQMQVPLVWQHGHNNPENVLGHAILEERKEGVYAYCFFNATPRAVHARSLLEHDDIKMMSIWANDLIERAGKVLHGAIREVSLVLSGANPGALIENVTIRHSDGDEEILPDEVIIKTGLLLEHAIVSHADGEDTGGEETIQDVYDSMTDKQKEVLHYMLGEAISGAGGDAKQDNVGESGDDTLTHADGEETINEVYESMNDKQKEVLHYMLGEAIDQAEVKHDNVDDKTDDIDETNESNNTQEGTTEMKHNLFDTTDGETTEKNVLSHDQMKEIIGMAMRGSSMRDAVDAYALQHGIVGIDTMFPDAKMVGSAPEWLKRRTAWVDLFLGATSKSPFSRIKTMYADITEEDARAKGYIKGTLKKEEFFNVAKRVTSPTTVFKKQKIDRDDMIDITDFDVVSWLKAEMRLMLDEEIARAALLGDGRDVASEDKINEGNIRPIASDHELYTITLQVNIDDALSSATEIIDTVIANRGQYKGTGNPYFFTTETQIAKFLLLKDSTGRRIYKNLEDLAADLRVQAVVPVDVMEEYPSIVGVILNPVDYRFGADAGGQVTMFDDFDIDYNAQKYLIETRTSGALAKLKSAMVIKKVASSAVLVVPTMPAFNAVTGVITIPTVTGVVYKRSDTNVVLTAGAQAALAAGATLGVYAEPVSASYYFESSDLDNWSFTRD